ncbi:MAG: outer membrane lipoprotein carrier protein LolA [Pseudomonadota bacterium]|nr:outer membrane lipoprotein carrier protein LolA [Pseudomonadota bacterium]
MPRTLLLVMMVGLGGASAACAAPPAARSAAPVTATSSLNDLDEVMGVLAMRQHGRVEFVEQQFLHVLNHPIESSGELRYDAPDRLEKRTLKPRAETLILGDGTLTMQRAHSRRVMDLYAYPQVLPFVESIRATLAGDRSALEKLFHLEFTGSVARWTLTLVPLDSKVRNSVTQVRIDGMRDQLLKVEIRQPDGDRSLMTLRPAPP